jgi:3-methyladenine DNA glycosylase AlkC
MDWRENCCPFFERNTMAEAFKNLINADTVAHAARHLQRVWPAFAHRDFERQALKGLEALEFKARAMQVAEALVATLPADFSSAAELIEASLAPPLPLDAKGEPVGLGEAERDSGLAGWVVWSLGEFVVRRGMQANDVPRALACLHALTQRFSAEFAIRPFIQRHPGPVLETLGVWAGDTSAHVRRLASEGSRPRLPWGLRLHALVADPSPTLPLLRALQDDSSAYVRRSVANHLNDIAKDHPALVAAWVVEHRAGASAAREAVLRHASRSLIKAGHAPTLQAWGLGQGLKGSTTLALSTARVAVGGEIVLSVDIHSSARQAQALVIDYVVHHVRANGGSSPKVFKGWKLALGAGEQRALSKRHSLRPVSTRRLYPGAHRVELMVNGQVLAQASFELMS